MMANAQQWSGLKRLTHAGLVALSVVAGSGLALTPRPAHAATWTEIVNEYGAWKGQGELICALNCSRWVRERAHSYAVYLRIADSQVGSSWTLDSNCTPSIFGAASFCWYKVMATFTVPGDQIPTLPSGGRAGWDRTTPPQQQK
jgi:hypothetical protein